MTSDMNTMRLFPLLILLFPFLGAQTLDLTSLGMTELKVPESGVYQFSWTTPPPVGEVGIWAVEKQGRTLISRNRGQEGQILTQWTVTLENDRTYLILLQGGATQGQIHYGKAAWGPLVTQLKQELTPVSRDRGELGWMGKLDILLPLVGAKVVPSSSGIFLGAQDSQGLKIYRSTQDMWENLGSYRNIEAWESWDLGVDKHPTLLYSFSKTLELGPEFRMDVWNSPDWQNINIFRDNVGGQVQLTNYHGILYGSYWQIQGLPQWKIRDLTNQKELPAPPNSLPLSSQYFIGVKNTGIWAVFQEAHGPDRWYFIQQFDGKLWTNMNFPVVKNPKAFLHTPGNTPLAGVIDSQGKPLIFRWEKEVWTALNFPEQWKYDPGTIYKLLETNTGIYLFSSGKSGFTYQRLAGGVWYGEVRLQGLQLLDLWNNPEGSGALVVQEMNKPGPLSLEFYSLP